MANYKIINNEQFNSKEIYFEGIPEKATREALKALKFRWNPKKACWYGFASDEEITTAFGAVLTIPAFKVTEKNTLYEGWEGGNCHKWHTDEELKKFILADLKKCGIKATMRFSRGGYTTAFTLTVTIKPEHIKGFEEWKKDFIPNYNGWNFYTDEAGKIDSIMGDRLYDCDPELLENITRTQYKIEVEHLTASGTYHKNNEEILTDEGNMILKAVSEILDSYNHNNSNSQIDYFDVSFYEHITFKVA